MVLAQVDGGLCLGSIQSCSRRGRESQYFFSASHLEHSTLCAHGLESKQRWDFGVAVIDDWRLKALNNVESAIGRFGGYWHFNPLGSCEVSWAYAAELLWCS